MPLASGQNGFPFTAGTCHSKTARGICASTVEEARRCSDSAIRRKEGVSLMRNPCAQYHAALDETSQKSATLWMQSAFRRDMTCGMVPGQLEQPLLIVFNMHNSSIMSFTKGT